jgi:altronate dehydratase
MRKLIYIHSKEDNVAVALKDLKAGEVVEVNNFKMRLIEDVSFGHKIALKDIKKGEKVIKYGEVIGQAIIEIKKGAHVHVHNIKSLRYT